MNNLEEWKANNDLFKWHEDLKQKRFSYFLTIQTAFIALYGLVLKEQVSKPSVLLSVFLLFIAFTPLIIVFIYSFMDDRARAYIDSIKAKLILIEKNWADVDSEKSFSTYTEQFEVLVHRKKDTVDRYLKVRGIGDQDHFAKLIKAKAAHLGEQKIFLMFKFLWIIFISIAIAINFIM